MLALIQRFDRPLR